MTTIDPPAEFDVCGPLPDSGTWILEASAGTGKTYTIAALAARYVATGQSLASIMMVTFSRAATRELRDRIRARLVATESGLRAVLAGGDPGADEVTRLLATGPGSEVRTRLARITAALADFDSATIATTHEFCGRMLDGLGVLADLDPLARHVESVGDLVRECAADLWLRKYAAAGPTRGAHLPWPQAVALAREVGDNRLPLEPADPTDVRWRFAQAVRREVATRKLAQGLSTYDDLLVDLDGLLDGRLPGAPEDDRDPALAEAVAQRLRSRFPIVLIDEFQDTDPVQWAIVRRAFVERSTVVLIGDPKQAIYGFRDADVHCYLDAVQGVEGAHHRTLSRNWRSDGPLVDALDALMGGAELGHERIAVRGVTAVHSDARLLSTDPELAAPLRIRQVPVGDLQRSPAVGRLRETIVADLVADVVTVLDGGTRLSLDGGAHRPVRPGDIAVLVSKNKKAEAIRRALSEAGVPAVHTGANSVFDTTEARDWQDLLQAFETGRAEHVRAVALTAFVGWTFAELATADEGALNELSATVRRWSKALEDSGVAALVEAMDGDGLAVRLLGQVGGERRYTDIRHIGQALHAARTQNRLGTAGLIDWLRARRAEAASSDDARTRRLETDADAVRVMTVHASKGLEFPIVYLPDRWDRYEPREPKAGPIRIRQDGRRALWIGADEQGRAEAHTSSLAEDRDEALRLLYVALTRAQCQVVCWWAGGHNTPPSALHRIVHRTAPAPSSAYAWSRDVAGADRVSAPGIAVSDVGHLATTLSRPAPVAAGDLGVRRFDRPVDAEWRRTSYSGLTAGAHERDHGVRAESLDDELAGPSDEPTSDEPTGDTAAVEPWARMSKVLSVTEDSALAALSPMADLPRGAAFGTLVHAVYETFDPAACDLAAELTRVAGGWLDRLPSSGLTPGALGAALLPSVETPLGPIADDLRLCDIPATDRLPELDFEYPLAGGDDPAGHVQTTLSDVADLLSGHLPKGDALAAYADHLRDPLLAPQSLRGYLIGSIDAVLRIPLAGGTSHRYLVVDYKTNWLGPLDTDDPLVLGHYTRSHLAEAMMTAHYPLQALLYCVALHRFLRWRQPGYDPAVHLGGVAYLFVRGMAGADTPVVDGSPCGVFDWQPPAALVTALSDLIDSREGR